jgi:hypothetical protein
MKTWINKDRRCLIALLCAALSTFASPHGALAQASVTTQATLLDRIQIEDLLIAYYQPLGSGGGDMTAFYTEDGVLDLNGRVYQGKAGVKQAYRDAAAAMGPSFKGKFHILMNNPRIVVNGESATADLIWTGVASESATAQPHLVEQGREHDDLVKLAGHWLLKKRVITSDGGLPDFYAKTYRDR